MRGRCRLAQNSRKGPLTLVRCAHSTSPRAAERGKKKFVRATRSAPEVCLPPQQQSPFDSLPVTHDPEKLALGLDPRVVSGFRTRSCAKEGSGTPVDADPYPPHPAVRLCLPLRKQLACRRSTRGSRQRDFRPKSSASGHASWDAAGAYDPLTALPGEERTPLHGRYPRRACPSPVKHLTRRS